jgi:hypothetical protein
MGDPSIYQVRQGDDLTMTAMFKLPGEPTSVTVEVRGSKGWPTYRLLDLRMRSLLDPAAEDLRQWTDRCSCAESRA